MNNKLPQIQAKIREVCPEMGNRCPDESKPVYDDLWLHHVLRAMYTTSLWDEIGMDLTWDAFLDIRDFEGKLLCSWNLTEPLHEQEDSVIDFLHSILCVQKS